MEEKIIAMLKEKGCKITPQRRAIIRTLVQLPKSPTAYDIHAGIRRLYPEIGLDTVYRNLHLLSAMGVVIPISLPGKDTKVFELASGVHHHHLICLGCGVIQCFPHCPVNEAQLQENAGPDFSIVGHSLELYGYCSGCRHLQDTAKG
ncbi:MAG: Fur family transcriptional regulator [Sporomusaceae bacterium]|nr:Fur family transcriptional regulator [Sporomusaceae bacterium]